MVRISARIVGNSCVSTVPKGDTTRTMKPDTQESSAILAFQRRGSVMFASMMVPLKRKPVVNVKWYDIFVIPARMMTRKDLCIAMVIANDSCVRTVSANWHVEMTPTSVGNVTMSVKVVRNVAIILILDLLQQNEPNGGRTFTILVF